MKEKKVALDPLYGRIVEDLPHPICRFSMPDGILSFANAAFCSSFRVERKDISGKCFLDFMPREEHERMKNYLSGLSIQTPSVVFDQIFQMPGGPRWQRWISKAVFDHTDSVVEIQCVIEDITEHKWVENELRRSEERYRAIFENTGTATIIIEQDTTISLANALFEQLSGLTRTEIEWKKSWTEFIVKEDLLLMKKYHELRRVDPASVPNEYEFHFLNNKGEIRDIYLNIRMIPGTNQSVASCLDITERKKAEEGLRRSEEKYRSILESIEEGYFEVDLKGNVTFFNESMLDSIGFSRDEILGMSYRKYIAPASYDKVYEAFHEVYLTGKTLPLMNYDVIHKDGAMSVHEMSVSLIRDEQGRPSGFRGVARDVTERKKAEERLRQSEEKYRHILENMEDTYYEVDLTGIVTFCNPAGHKMVGYGPDELIGKNFKDLVYSENIERVFRVFHRVFLTDESTKAFDWELVRKDGIRIVIEASVSLRRDQDGRTTGFKGIIRDVTESRRAEQALRESERKYRMLAENVREVIWTMDYDLKGMYISPSIENLLGYTPREALKIPLRELMTSESYAVMRSTITDKFIPEKERLRQDPFRYRTLEIEHIRKDGTRIWAEVTMTHLLNEEGYPIGIIGVTRDISERKTMEEEKSKLEERLEIADRMKAVGTLAGGIAHDFNNLLMGIQGNASLMLMDTNPGHPHIERIRNVEEYVRRGAELTRQLLGFARGGKYELKSTDLGEFIAKSSQMFERTRKEIHILRENQPDLWPVEVDQGQMEQILLNLYLNAWQAMPSGGELFIKTENVILGKEDEQRYRSKAGRYVKISIRDTGIGMDEETRKRIFEPFFTTKEIGRGTGLGLASVYGIVKNHGGIIDVESEKGIGTTFFIFLPASQKSAREEKPVPEEILYGHDTLLLVDDEEMILDVGMNMLNALGYKVLTARSGPEAIDIYRERKGSIDLVILDMIMPGLGGRQTFEHLHEINSEICVLLSSGYSLGGQAQEIMENGCKGFIQKPFDMKSLSRKIREILDNR